MIELTLTEEQAKIVSEACEFYARIRLGQFNEILMNSEMQQSMDDRGYFARVDAAEKMLMGARALVYPELGTCVGAHYGIGKFHDADVAFNVHQILRYELGDSRKPFVPSGMHECKKVKEK